MRMYFAISVITIILAFNLASSKPLEDSDIELVDSFQSRIDDDFEFRYSLSSGHEREETIKYDEDNGIAVKGSYDLIDEKGDLMTIYYISGLFGHKISIGKPFTDEELRKATENALRQIEKSETSRESRAKETAMPEPRKFESERGKVDTTKKYVRPTPTSRQLPANRYLNLQKENARNVKSEKESDVEHQREEPKIETNEEDNIQESNEENIENPQQPETSADNKPESDQNNEEKPEETTTEKREEVTEPTTIKTYRFPTKKIEARPTPSSDNEDQSEDTTTTRSTRFPSRRYSRPTFFQKTPDRKPSDEDLQEDTTTRKDEDVTERTTTKRTRFTTRSFNRPSRRTTTTQIPTPDESNPEADSSEDNTTTQVATTITTTRRRISTRSYVRPTFAQRQTKSRPDASIKSLPQENDEESSEVLNSDENDPENDVSTTTLAPTNEFTTQTVERRPSPSISKPVSEEKEPEEMYIKVEIQNDADDSGDTINIAKEDNESEQSETDGSQETTNLNDNDDDQEIILENENNSTDEPEEYE